MAATTKPVPRCSVAGAERLPVETGGEKALCDAIHTALGTALRPAVASVHIEVKQAALTATVTMKSGATTPRVGYALSDAQLKRESFGTFAATIAQTVRELVKA